MQTTKLALVTGASRGLGLALARGLANAGWQLVLTARGAAELEAVRHELAAVTTVLALPGDVTDPRHRAALVDAVAGMGGHLDALVNNAGALGPSPLPAVVDLDPRDLAPLFETNVVAPLALIGQAAGLLGTQAAVVNLTSDAAVAAYPGWAAYGASKAALEQASHILAAEKPEWRVYWVDPGDMRTAMHQAAFPGEDISDRPVPEASVPGLLALITGNLPSGRYQAREVGKAVAHVG